MTVSEEITKPDYSITPARIVCLPIEDSKISRDTLQWSLAHVAHKNTFNIILIHVRPYPRVERMYYAEYDLLLPVEGYLC